MLAFSSGMSTSVNTKVATQECVEIAMGEGGGADCDLIALHSTMGHNPNQVIAALRNACPNATIIGCTGSGVIGREGVSESMRSLAIMTVQGKEFSVASADGLNGDNSFELGERVAREIKENHPDVNMLYLLTSGLDLRSDQVIEGVESVFGPEMPIFGATAADNGKAIKTLQFHDDLVMEHGVVLAGFADPTLELVLGIHHGSVPLESMKFEITKSDGNKIIELDGEPAWPTLMAKLDLPADSEAAETMGMTGLGVDLSPEDGEAYDNPQVLRVPLVVEDDHQSFRLPTTCPEGSHVALMQRDEQRIFDGVERMNGELNGRRPAAVFHADCMARGRLTFNRVLKDEIIAKTQYPVCGEDDVPWLGVYGYSEYAPLRGKNQFHSYTTSIFALVRKEGA